MDQLEPQPVQFQRIFHFFCMLFSIIHYVCLCVTKNVWKMLDTFLPFIPMVCKKGKCKINL
uniref:Alternative protein DTNA n=1 Tax=Homo sapiens TaxID=9606 RepID=L8E9H2_HUMAN|nr:alternative protein DTNA [Homo sapiens]